MLQFDVYDRLLRECASFDAELIAVSKSKPVADIQALYDRGQKAFGENRVQEWAAKKDQLAKDIDWHLVGHLQTNKVKQVAGQVSMIQSVDSVKLIQEIDRRAIEAGTTIDCLLQVHIATEETKFGFSSAELEALLAGDAWPRLQGVQVCGLMGIASLTENDAQVRAEFRGLRTLFDKMKRTYFQGHDHFVQLSMGMSGDYRIALEEGSTMIRIGSLVFGER